MKSNRILIITASLAAILLYFIYSTREVSDSAQNENTTKENNAITTQENLWDSDPNVLYLKADSLLNLNQLDTALLLVKQAELILGNSSEDKRIAFAKNLYLKAYILQEKGDFDEAIAAYEKCIKIRQQLDDPPIHSIATANTNIGTCLFSQQQYTRSLENHKIAERIWSEMGAKAEPYLAISYSNQASCYGMMGEYRTAIEQLEKVIELNKEKFISNPISVATTYDNLGIWARNIGDWKSAITHHENALNILVQLDSSYTVVSSIANTYNNLAMCYELRGDEEKTLAYYEKALRLRQNSMDNKEPLQVAISLENVGMHLSEQGAHETGISLVEQALDIRRTHLSGDTIASFQHLCYCMQLKKDFEKAKRYCQLALNYQLKKTDHNLDKIAVSYESLAEIYFEQGLNNRAITTFKQAYEIWNNLHGQRHFFLAGAANSLGSCYQKDNNLKGAIEWYHKALIHNNYSDRNFENVLSIPTLIETFQNISATHRKAYNKNNNLTSLRQAYKNYQKAADGILFQRFNIAQSSNKNALNTISHQVQEEGIHTAHQLYEKTDSLSYLSNMFLSSEAAKARTLFEALHQAEALHFAGIPDDLLAVEKELRVDIANIQEKIFHLDQQKEGDKKAVDKLHDQLFQHKKNWEQLVQIFQKKYPDYYKLKFNLNTTSVNEVQQKMLNPQQSVLEFFTGDSTIYLFLIQQNNYEVHQIPRDFPLEQWVKNLTQDGIYGYYGEVHEKRTIPLLNTSNANYTLAAQQLYNKLIAPVKDKLTEQLIIIPDGVLGYIPFEVLLKDPPKKKDKFSSYPFMVYDHQISYCYSATLLREMKEKQHLKTPTKSLLAMAPFSQNDIPILVSRIDTAFLFTLRDSISPLHASGEEVSSIGKLWKGKTYYGQKASIIQFNEQAEQYRILHFSTHGKADDRVGDYAYLAFGTPTASDNFEKLYARDLYNYSLNADMVVLSACETGIGKLQKGEGIISLARAFAYAGAKSIFTTLWQVNDEKTKDLMIAFYKQLKKGETKDAALRNAKLEFLKQTDGEFMHPFFWGGMIGIGDMSEVKS